MEPREIANSVAYCGLIRVFITCIKEDGLERFS
jgi:hypothetical protein